MTGAGSGADGGPPTRSGTLSRTVSSGTSSRTADFDSVLAATVTSRPVHWRDSLAAASSSVTASSLRTSRWPYVVPVTASQEPRPRQDW